MEKQSEGQAIVGSDDRKIGVVAGERDGCVLVQTGHVFKTTHALPKEFVHEIDGELRATIAKEIVDGSPRIGDDWNPREVRLYYGIGGKYRIDPDPEEMGSAKPDFEQANEIPRGGGLDETRVAQGDSGSWSPVLPRKN